MSNPSRALCVQCDSQPAHHVNCYGRGLCATCFTRFLELEGMAPPKDREDISGRLAAWGAPRESVTLCWHVAPGEDWSERWRGYLGEWMAVTRLTLLMPSTELEQCEHSGELRQIIRWRLWKADVPGFVERFLTRDLSWETRTCKTRDGTYAHAMYELVGKPRRGPRRRGGLMTPEDFRAQSDEAYRAHRADFSGREPTQAYVARSVGYSVKQWRRWADELDYSPPS